MHLTKFLVTAIVLFLTQLIESPDSDPRSNGFYAHFLFYQIEILRIDFFILRKPTGLHASQHVKFSKQIEYDEQLNSANREGNCRLRAFRKFPQINIRVQHNNISKTPTDIT
jgi:hypothetical protein